MSDKEQDDLEKIDAMLERHDADFLTHKKTSSDDFPLLTEVIEEVRSVVLERLDRSESSLESDRRLTERRIRQRRQSTKIELSAPVLSDDLEPLLAALEHRLTALFTRQQLQMDETLRKAVRDCLGRDESRES